MSEATFTVEKEKLEVTTSRAFKATPERLWEAMTDSEQITKWWGPAIYKTTVDTNDVRVGGSWRIISTDDQGNASAFRGEFL
jgi:uncharacterized protein YndB with AHSA1/START domain